MLMINTQSTEQQVIRHQSMKLDEPISVENSAKTNRETTLPEKLKLRYTTFPHSQTERIESATL